jgi:hypothetical protein
VLGSELTPAYAIWRRGHGCSRRAAGRPLCQSLSPRAVEEP